MQLPMIGLGTWLLTGQECEQIVKTALNVGYRHIDTASAYDNHKAIKKGIAGFPRSELFLTSKFTMDQIDDAKIDLSVEKACNLALKELGTDYLDLYLIHWPDHHRPMARIFAAMEKLVQKGKAHQIGVCNNNIHHLQDLGSHKPSANQVEFHPYLYQKDLWHYCQERGIQLIAYRPFGKGSLIKEPTFQKIGKKHGKSGGQIILRWIIQKGIPVIPKASSESHLKENLAVFDFSLTPAEMEEIDSLNKNKRYCQPDHPEFQY